MRTYILINRNAEDLTYWNIINQNYFHDMKYFKINIMIMGAPTSNILAGICMQYIQQQNTTSTVIKFHNSKLLLLCCLEKTQVSLLLKTTCKKRAINFSAKISF
jgi:hypothetical protein